MSRSSDAISMVGRAVLPPPPQLQQRLSGGPIPQPRLPPSLLPLPTNAPLPMMVPSQLARGVPPPQRSPPLPNPEGGEPRFLGSKFQSPGPPQVPLQGQQAGGPGNAAPFTAVAAARPGGSTLLGPRGTPLNGRGVQPLVQQQPQQQPTAVVAPFQPMRGACPHPILLVMIINDKSCFHPLTSRQESPKLSCICSGRCTT